VTDVSSATDTAEMFGLPFSDITIANCQVMQQIGEHGEEIKFDFDLETTSADQHPQESKQFDGRQLPLDPKELKAVMHRVTSDKDKLLKEASEVLGPENRKLIEEFDKILNMNLNSFRDELIGEGPVRGVNMVPTTLKPGADKVTFSHKTRIYTAEQMQFLSEICQKFVKAGMIVRCEPQRTSSPALVIKKPNGKGFRMVIDLRMANKLVEDLAAPAVHLDMVRNCLSGSTLYGTYDLTDGYWQVAMDEMGRRIYSFQTHQGNFQLLRLPQGAKNSAAIFQSMMNQICGDYLYRKGTGCIPYLDDLLLYARSPSELVELHRFLLGQFSSHNIKVKLAKSQLAAREVSWIGFRVNQDGLKQPTSRVDALLRLQRPTNAAELGTFLGALNWMRSWLGVNYLRNTTPLQDAKQKAIQLAAGSQKASSLRKINLEKHGLWTDAVEKAWSDCLQMVAKETLTLAHPDSTRNLLHVFSDASDNGWGGFCTQTPLEEAGLPVEEQNHQALGFCSGSFRDSQARWSTFDQEAWALMATVEYFAPFLLNSKQPFVIHTDHKNLIYIFSADKSALNKQTRDRVARWAVQLMRFNFILEHIDGELNEMADLLSRWKQHCDADNSDVTNCLAFAVLQACQREKDSGAQINMSRELRRLQAGPSAKWLHEQPKQRPRPQYGAENSDCLAGDRYIDPAEPVAEASVDSRDASDSAMKTVDEGSWLGTMNESFTWDSMRTQYDRLSHHDFIFPDCSTLRSIQNSFLAETDVLGGSTVELVKKQCVEDPNMFYKLKMDVPIRFETNNNLWITKRGKIWIPQRATHLQVCLAVLAHSGIAGHASEESTLRNLKDEVEWSSMTEDVKRFCRQCLHCLGAKLGKKIPRPLASTIHGTYPNHVMRLDFVSMPDAPEAGSNKPFMGILVMKDDATQYCWLVPVKQETAEEVAKAILDWSAKSRMPAILAVDRGSHFINNLLEKLKELAGLMEIVPSVASNKQTHGGSENLNAQVRKIFRCISSERQISDTRWIELVSLVNHVLNHRASPLLGGLAPVELFTGQKSQSQLSLVVRGKSSAIEEAKLEKVKFYKDFKRDLLELRIMLNNLHRKALVSAEAKRASSRESTNKNRPEFKAFETGDFVLRAIPEGSSMERNRSKVRQRWVGPYRIVHVKSEKVYICEDLLTGVLYELHADHLYRYAGQGLDVSSRIKRQLAFDTLGKEAKKILDFKIVNSRPLVQLKWKGVRDSEEENCWHPLGLALHFWPLEQVLHMLSSLKDNVVAERFVSRVIEANESKD